MYALVTIFAIAVVVAAKGAVTAKCYKTTRSILEAQLADVNNEIREYVICPGTTLQVGPPTNTAFSRYLFNHYPLLITKPNITIKCGDNGSRRNNCLLASTNSRAVFLAMAFAEVKDWGLTNVSISGSKLQGITFAGYQFAGRSHITSSGYVILLAPGKDFVIEDCAFANTVTDLGIIIGRGSSPLVKPEQVPTGSISLTVRNSYFYRNDFWGWVLYNDDHSLTVENCIFDNTTYVGPDPVAGAGSGVLFRSRHAGVTSVVDSCVRNGLFAQSLVQNAYDNSAKFTKVPECTLQNVYGSGNVIEVMPSNCPQYGFCPEGYQVGFRNVTDDTNTMLSCTTVDMSAPSCPATVDTYVPCFVDRILLGPKLC